MAVSSSNSAMVEVREEIMVSPTGKNPTFRKAHFLKPSKDSIFTPSSNPQLLSLPSLISNFEPQKLGSRVHFCGWKTKSTKNWADWVKKMQPLHESTWKKAGIFESIINSTFQIRRNEELVFRVAEKWCKETQSFIFSWGEATITLEDVMILGGYSVLGSPVFISVENEELKEKEKALEKSRSDLHKTPCGKPLQSLWMKKFMENELEIEHEAFLVYWLSRFVFPSIKNLIDKRVFAIAIELARGNRVALAPAVLASIYRDLSNLKAFILTANEAKIDDLSVSLKSPLQLVQVWVWERFLELQPRPNVLKNSEPRLARWNGVNVRIRDARLALEKARFEWRPYAEGLTNWKLPKFYAMKEMCVASASDFALDEDVLSFARCIRVSMLVGVEFVEPYLPNRVCLQFGMDQDVPDSVVASSESVELAWRDYSKRVKGLYVPSRFFEGGVTVRYFDWWKELMLSQKKPKKFKKVSDFLGCSSSGSPLKLLKCSAHCSSQGKEESFDSDSELPESPLENVEADSPSSYLHRYRFRFKNVPSYCVDSDSSTHALPVEEDEIRSPALSIAEKEVENSPIHLGSPPNGKTVNPATSIAEKEVENSPIHPGFPSKGKMVCPASFRAEKEVEKPLIPPGFPPKDQMVNPTSSIAEKEVESSQIPHDLPPEDKMANSASFRAGKEVEKPLIPPGFPPVGKMANPASSIAEKEVESSPIPPGLPPNGKTVNPASSIGEKEVENSPIPPGLPPNGKTVNLASSIAEKEDEISPIHPGFPSKGKMANPASSRAEMEVENLLIPSGFTSKGKMTNPASSIAEKEVENSPIPPGFPSSKGKMVNSASFRVEKEVENLPIPPGFPPEGKMANPASFRAEKEVEKPLIPPGFLPVGKMVDAERPVSQNEEDQLTIAEMCGGSSNGRNSSEKHSDGIVDEYEGCNGLISEIYVLSSEFEDRISKLEEDLKRYKAAKLGNKNV